MAAALAIPASAAGSTVRHRAFTQVNLVSDVHGLAKLTDPLVSNPWGISLGPTTPLWVTNNNTGTATLYQGANGKQPISKVPLTVKLSPGPTGTVFNFRAASNPHGFVVTANGKSAPSLFMFNSLAGNLIGWSLNVPPITKSHNVQHVARAVYTGLAEATTKRGGRLFAADASMGTVDVFNAKFKKVASFRDPSLPRSVTPYNVALLRGKLYVTFAPPPGPTSGLQGAIDVFSLSGHKLRRLVTGGPLFAPWGMVIAPRHWGGFGGDLLVGNVDNGRINAFNPNTGRFQGTLRNKTGKAIANSGLWGLAFGNGVIGTPRTLLFSAGIDNYSHGLVGLIRPAKPRLRRLTSSTGMSSGRGLAPFIVERRQTPGGHAARWAGPRRCNAHWVGFTVDGLVYKALQLTFAQVPWTSGPARGHSPAARLLHFRAARGLFVQKPNRDADCQGCGPSDLERPCGLFSAWHGVWPPVAAGQGCVTPIPADVQI